MTPKLSGNPRALFFQQRLHCVVGHLTPWKKRPPFRLVFRACRVINRTMNLCVQWGSRRSRQAVKRRWGHLNKKKDCPWSAFHTSVDVWYHLQSRARGRNSPSPQTMYSKRKGRKYIVSPAVQMNSWHSPFNWAGPVCVCVCVYLPLVLLTVMTKPPGIQPLLPAQQSLDWVGVFWVFDKLNQPRISCTLKGKKFGILAQPVTG